MQNNRSLLMVAISAVLGAGGADVAQAQDSKSSTRALEEVVVSAQRREEALEAVPITVNSLSSESLQQASVTRLEDISRLAPAVSIARTGIYVQPSIRGVTTTQTSNAENNIAIYVDNFYQASTMSLNMDMLNVSSVQVLKGPQGTLFGRNATGGAILVETKKPSLQESEGAIKLAYGSFDDKSGQIYYSTPITDVLAFNVAASRRRSDGYLENITGFDSAPLKSDAVLTKLLIEPSDELRIIASYDYSYVRDGRSLAITMDDTATPLAKIYFPSQPVTTERNKTSLNHPSIIEGKQNAASLTVTYDFPSVTLSSYSYRQKVDTFTNFEADGSLGVVYDEYLSQDYDTTSQELNLTSTGDGRLQYVLGLFYFDSEVDFHDDNFFFFGLTGGGYAPRNSTLSDTKSQAAYADVTWEVIDHLFLTGGIRYNREEKDSVTTSPAGAIVVDKNPTFYSTTPRVVVRYELSPSTNVYASYSEGFKSGQVNTVAPFTEINPEEIKAYEIGFKTKQDTFSFSTSAYTYDYTDLQLATIVNVGGAVSSIVTNAASAEISGAEADVVWYTTDALKISANVAYTHARYDSFANAPVQIPSATTGLNSGRCGANLCTQDLSGKQMVRAPEWSGSIGATYTLGLGAHTVIVSGNASATDSYLPNKSDLGLNGKGYRYEQSGYALYSARVDWVLPGDQLKLSVYGTNLFDKGYDVYTTGADFGDYHVEGQPRSYGASAEYKF